MGELQSNKTFTDTLEYCKKNNKTLHFIGLVSDGGVHSHIKHLKALCDYSREAGLNHYAVHAFTDGRDTDPKSGAGFLLELQNHLQGTPGVLASVTGRYYAMDRDKRWERVKIAYDALVHGTGKPSLNVLQSVKDSYEADITDEFLQPIIAVDNNGKPLATIKEGDAVICFNFRTDRCREITEVLTQHAVPEQNMEPLSLHYVTMTEYDHQFKNVHVIFHNDNLNNTIGEVLAKDGLKQIRIAETEKYPHVTFFFSGGRKSRLKGKNALCWLLPKKFRRMILSLK
jgi:2,3-bisphosphoglycerate-independent phosphoglycerate mutase